MDIFSFRRHVIDDYAAYTRSFIQIRDIRLREFVDGQLDDGVLWPEPLLQLNPSFEPGAFIDDLVTQGVLHAECRRIFRIKPDAQGDGQPLRLHRHQTEAIQVARTGQPYVLTTGTGSGKSMAYIVPIVDHVLRHGSGRGIKVIVVYPMNALANSQQGELRKFLCHGYPDGRGPVTFERYTGQESNADRERILAQPPDILLTNYVMLELILTRPQERPLIQAAQGLQFLVLDELHTYRGRQGADVAMLIRRARDVLSAPRLQCVGTSATLAGTGSFTEQQTEVAVIGSQLFGMEVRSANVIGETLRRATPARDESDSGFVAALNARLSDASRLPPTDYAGFVNDPLSVWIESKFGVQLESGHNRFVRVRPRSIGGPGGAATDLHRLASVPVERCLQAIQEQLQGSYRCERDPQTNRPPFAFRLHQFISRGDTVYVSLEREDARHLTLQAQQFVPGDRECSYQHYNEWRSPDANSGTARLHRDDASLVMRWAMGLLDAREIAIVGERQRLLGEQAQAASEVERHTTFMNATLPALRARLGFGDGDLPDGFFAARAREVTEQRIQSLEGLLIDFTDDTRVSRLHEQAVSAAQTVAVVVRALEEVRGLRQQADAELRQRRVSSVEDYYTSFEPRRNCPLLECPFRPENRADGMADPERAARIADLDAVLGRHDRQIADLEEQFPALRQQHADAETQYVQERRRREGNIAGTLRDIGRWQLLMEEVREYEAAWRSREDQQARVDRLDRNIRESRERQEAARDAQAESHRRLSQCFDWTLKRLLMPEAGGAVRLDARGMHPEPDNTVAANGAALATLATVLGLDLACLTASVCGLGHLPRLLIHDSPKEADMEPVLYERIFMLALELERTFGQRPLSFQYIVTTTTPPPAEIAGEPYTRLTLDARDDGELLLNARF